MQTALLEGDLSLEDSAIADAIDDDDVSFTDEDEHKLLGDENDDELLKSPVSTPTTVAIPDLLAEEKTSSAPDAAAPTKKIVLKRNNSQQSTGTVASTGTTPSKENEAPAAAASDSTGETPTKKHKPIVVGPKTEGEKPSGDKKLNQLTAQERLELRAKKFGITPPLWPTLQPQWQWPSINPLVPPLRPTKVTRKPRSSKRRHSKNVPSVSDSWCLTKHRPQRPMIVSRNGRSDLEQEQSQQLPPRLPQLNPRTPGQRRRALAWKDSKQPRPQIKKSEYNYLSKQIQL